MKALISGIKRMEIHDGDGLRTTVFFKGCPLTCIWCHNPESTSALRQLAFFPEKCIGCNSCAAACPENRLERKTPPPQNCSMCLGCTQACPTNALISFGTEYTLDQLLATVLQDEAFFQNGNGGVTLSGGECLMQAEFVTAFAKVLCEKGISVNVDTCGYVKREILSAILPYTDTFLYDIKAFDHDLHHRLTGRDNDLILENLVYLSSQNAKIEIRYPLVKGYNDGECEQIAAFLAPLQVTRVKVLQYHRFAASRYAALGMENTMPQTETSFEDIEACVKIFRQYGIKSVNGMTD